MNLIFLRLTLLSLIVLIVVSAITSCTPAAQDGAGKALDNAGSLVKTGMDKLWIDPGPTATPTPLTELRY